MRLLGKFFIVTGAVAATLFAVAVGLHAFLPDRPPYLHEAGAAAYVLALIGAWAAMHRFGWPLRRRTAGLAILMALAAVVIYCGLLYLTVGSWPQVFAVDPLQALAANTNYLIAGVGSLVVLLAIVAVLGLLLLRALAGTGGPIWGLAGLALAIASGALAAALALQVFGALRDPAMAALGAQIMPFSLYGHIAAWLVTAVALFASLGPARQPAAVAAADAPAPGLDDDEVTLPLVERAPPEEPTASTPATDAEPRPLAPDERTVRSTPPSKRVVSSVPPASPETVRPGEAKPVTVVRRPGVQPTPLDATFEAPKRESAARPASEDAPTVRTPPQPKSTSETPGDGDGKT